MIFFRHRTEGLGLRFFVHAKNYSPAGANVIAGVVLKEIEMAGVGVSTN
jgi:hypothetical protein